MLIRLRIVWVLVAQALLPYNANAQTTNEVENLHLQQAAVEMTHPSIEQAADFIVERLENGGIRNMLDSYLRSDISAVGNYTLVNQVGIFNAADLFQVGFSNLAVVSQQGSGNTTFLEQFGNSNIFGTWLIGNGNHVSVRQDGDENLYVLDFVGDNLSHSIQQIGDGIEAYQIGAASHPFSIEQYGTGMNIRIEHNMP